MEAIKKNINQVNTAFSKPVDPRIDSPQIKVVYPAVLKDLPAEEPSVQPSPPTEPPAPVPQVTPAPQTANAAPSTNATPAPSVGWKEVIKQNSMLFIIVGLLGLGLGFLLGKNKG